MNQFNFVVMEEVVKKFTCWETEPALEEGGEDNYLVGVGCWNVFILSRPPLKDGTGRKEMIVDEFEKLVFINRRQPEYLGMRGNRSNNVRVLCGARCKERKTSTTVCARVWEMNANL
jgi:hypothetical protein